MQKTRTFTISARPAIYQITTPSRYSIRLQFHLLDDQPLQDVDDEAQDLGEGGVRLDDGAHEEVGDVGQLHQLLQHDGHHLLAVDLLVLEAQLGGLQHCNNK